MSLSLIPVQHSLQQLAPIIRKDPISWAGWQAMQISMEIEEAKEEATYPKEALEKLVKLVLKNIDSTIFFCKSGEIVIIAEGATIHKLRMLAHEVESLVRLHNYTVTGHKIYDLSEDWRRFAFICERQEAESLFSEIDVSFDEERTLISDMAEELFSTYHMQDNLTGKRRRPKVMVIEDDPLTRKIVSKVLKDEVDLVIASNLHEGLLYYALHMPDLVFLDLNLERANDGKVFLETVRKYDDQSQIVMFSGNSYLENRIDTLTMGANGFIAKPFRKEQLMHYIEQVV